MNRPVVSFVVIAVVNLVLTGAAILFTVHAYQVTRARQERQGQVVELKLCTTLDKLAALRPPAGKPGDLSRAYLRRQHDVLAQLGSDVGCTNTIAKAQR